MATLVAVLSLCMVITATAAMEGVSNEDDWAYQWYTGEPFRFQCQTSGLNFSENSYVVWDTPTKDSLPTGYDDGDYQLKTTGNIRDVELLIKNVQAEFHGVYRCNVYGSSALLEGKVIYGLNVHDVKYRDMQDKYSHNIVVAFIATAIFVGPFATICLVWQFHYEKRAGRKQKQINGRPYEMKEPMPADGNASSDEKMGYVNTAISTDESTDLSTQL